MAPIGVALIGGGLFAKQAHMPAIMKADNLALKAIYSRSLKSAKETAALNTRSGQEPDLYSADSGSGKSFDDLLAREDIEAVIIALPIPSQPEHIRAALAAGKHVLAEKPLAPTVADGQKLIEYYRGLGGKATFSIAENFRYKPSFDYAAAEASKLAILLGVSVGLPLASLAINRRLASLRNASACPHPNARRREALIDTLICVLPTLIFMAVHYTQQGHRYDLIEGFGCYPSTYVTEPGFVLVILPPMLIALTSAVYACLSIQFFWRRQKDFEKFLRNSSNNMSRSTYTRLMLMASVELFITLPVTTTLVIIAVKKGGIAHWVSWADTKWGFNRHDSVTRFMLESAGPASVAGFEASRWLYPFCCFLFFGFFGFSAEVFRSYYNLVARISLKVFNKPMPSWDERNSTRPRSSTAPSEPFTFTVFGRTIAFYSRGSWKKATDTTLNNSVSVALPQHMDYNSATGRKKRADSLSFISGDGFDEVAMKHDGYSANSPTSDDASSVNEKEISDYLADLPVLDTGALDIPAPARAHTRSPSRASEQLSIHVDIERAEARI